MYRFQRITHISLVALMVTPLVLAGCGGANGAEEPTATGDTARRSLRVETLVLQPTTFEDVIELTGTVESMNDATLSAQTAGTVEYLAPLGRRLAKGDVVAQLDQALIKAALQQAQARVEAAQAQLEWDEYNFERQEKLYRDSIISALEFQTAQTQLSQSTASLHQAQAARAQAQGQLDYTTIKAPFSGTVEAHLVDQSEQVAPGIPVARVVSTRRVKVTVGVPERYAGDINVGTPVQLDFQAYRGQARTGRVTFAGSAIDAGNRTFPVEIEIGNADGRLKPEMIAQVYVTREQFDSVLVVPRAAVLRDEEGINVFVVEEQDGVATARLLPVTLGSSYAGRVIIEEGLEPNTEVVVLGQTTITEGDALNVVEQYNKLDAAGVPVKVQADTAAIATSLN